MWRRLKGERGAAAEETGKVSFFLLRGEGAGWVGGGWGRSPAPACLPLLPSSPFLAPPSSEPSPHPWITAPLIGFCFPGLSWLEDTPEQKGSGHPPEEQ